jgi:hypothetical protein
VVLGGFMVKSRDGATRRSRRPVAPAQAAARMLAAAMLVLVAGCSSLNPINLYRDITGASKNDPPPDADNTKNLAAGADSPYPNLGNVPDTPTRGLTESQRKALADDLIADRNNARYSDEQLRAGTVNTIAAPRPPGSQPVPAATEPAAAVPAAAPSAAAEPAQPPAVASNFATGRGIRGKQAPAAPADQSDNTVPLGTSRESSLVPPMARAEPIPDTPREPPPEAQLPPLPRTVPTAAAPISSQAAPPASSPQEALAPREAPAAPALAPTPTANAAPQPNVSGTGIVKREVAQVGFTGRSVAVDSTESSRLKDVPALHKQYGGFVRVVGYASRAPGVDDSNAELQSYQAALAHAEAVKQLLISSGIAASEIRTEASPTKSVPGDTRPDRADVFIEY